MNRMNRTQQSRPQRPGIGLASQRGATMIEVLVSVVILLIALLGTAGLIARSGQSEMESYQRAQALTLLKDMVARINANRQAAPCYASGSTMTVMGNATVAPPVCTGVSNAQLGTATADLAAWSTALQGSAESSSGTAVGAMIGALGCIESIDATNQIYRVTVAWQGLAQTVTSSLPCGAGSFGNDANRRAISVTVRIGVLS
ncbi:type IV pilus modification protein PilV [Cupriavidus metallidurans]|uniref:type IV pilus modification protein PilV n=1 Tax=Cupriavidus metallidurans TaxID=119219 RepID=UPI001CCB4E62|nr:type IV pilus modification protein PilV [Cupriavidus metallidurans]UBM09421.1 type IV pilus modification protein PilV [Cupriavidus metallidurans]